MLLNKIICLHYTALKNYSRAVRKFQIRPAASIIFQFKFPAEKINRLGIFSANLHSRGSISKQRGVPFRTPWAAAMLRLNTAYVCYNILFRLTSLRACTNINVCYVKCTSTSRFWLIKSTWRISTIALRELFRERSFHLTDFR